MQEREETLEKRCLSRRRLSVDSRVDRHRGRVTAGTAGDEEGAGKKADADCRGKEELRFFTHRTFLLIRSANNESIHNSLNQHCCRRYRFRRFQHLITLYQTNSDKNLPTPLPQIDLLR